MIVAPDADSSFGERDLRLARGIAQITSLALGNARRFHELERFHELVEGLDAIFWEADPTSLQLSFLSRKATELLGSTLGGSSGEPGRWGDHIHPDDRDGALAQVRSAVARGSGSSIEYRALEGGGNAVWIRDLLSVVHSPGGGISVVRGLMVDISERKRAEQALRESERKYSDAFEREREAASRLRALDEMKNTFLEAVSHDLRTPLTSILGSAITLEQSGLRLEHNEALDLVGRIASNARKLERLLSDLLNLDRLQRGIIAPQRRPTDVGALARLACAQTELLGDRRVDLQIEPAIVNVDAAKVERIVENLLVERGAAHAARRPAVGAGSPGGRRRPHRRRGRRAGDSSRAALRRVRAVPPAPGRLGSRAGGRHRALARREVRRAPRRAGLGRGTSRWGSLAPRPSAGRLRYAPPVRSAESHGGAGDALLPRTG